MGGGLNPWILVPLEALRAVPDRPLSLGCRVRHESCHHAVATRNQMEDTVTEVEHELIRKLDMMTADLEWACETLDAMIRHLKLDQHPDLELERYHQMRARLREDGKSQSQTDRGGD